MAYTVRFTPKAARDLKALPRDIQARVLPKIEALAHNPRPAGSESLRGFANTYRIRIGDYRVVYEIQETVVTVSVSAVGHRREIYRNLM